MSARERQKDILEKELTSEQSALAKAKEELAAQEAVRSGDERNYARVLERLQPYKDSVETHEKNIEALRRELNNLYR
jgi:phage shock protein A